MLPKSLQNWVLCGATIRSCKNQHPCCHSQQKAPDLEMNVDIPLSHWICWLILLIFTKIMLKVCQQEAWITLSFFLQHCVSPALKVLWPWSVMEEIKQMPITLRAIPRSGQSPHAHFSFFSSETATMAHNCPWLPQWKVQALDELNHLLESLVSL